MYRFRPLLVSLAALFGLTACCGSTSSDEFGHLYAELPFDMPRVERPAIPDYELSIVDFGAKGDGITKNTEAFRAALDSLAAHGGGRLIVPEGVWYTGPIELKDNTELFLTPNAILVFSSDKEDYPLISTIFEGLETRRCVSPISAKGARNIAITGGGTIDGSGGAWRPVKKGKMTSGQWSALLKSGGVLNDKKDIWFPSEGSKKGFELSDMNVPRELTTEAQWMEIRDFLRPVMVSLQECENVLLEGVTFQNSPSWNIHPLMCRNMIVNRVTIRNPWYAQNGDGIDVESCTNVLIINSSLDVGDDAVCIKSGKDEDGRRRGIPSSNIIVDNCTVFHGHGGFVVGSEMSGGVKNISVSNCRFLGTDVGLRFKSNRGRGGVVENIHISDISMIDIPTEPLLFDLFYGGKSASEALADGEDSPGDSQMVPVDETTPQFKDIYIRNISCRGARRAMFFNGLPEMNVSNINLENCSIYSTLGAEINESDGVQMKNVSIVNSEGPALILKNVKNLTAEAFDCAEGKETALKVSGSKNKSISIRCNRITPSNASITPTATAAVELN